MSLKINNGAEITKVYLNGKEYNALHLNNKGHFGKRFSLTQNSSAGVTFARSRSSSPNQQAGVGTINTGNVIYFGDVITLNATASTNYINPHLFVDTGDENGMLERPRPFTFTVKNNVSYYGTATYVAPPPQWKSVSGWFELVDWELIYDAIYRGAGSIGDITGYFSNPDRPTRITAALIRAVFLFQGKGFQVAEESETEMITASDFGTYFNGMLNISSNGKITGTTQIGPVPPLSELNNDGEEIEVKYIKIKNIEQWF